MKELKDKQRKRPKELKPLSPGKAHSIRIICKLFILGILAAAGWLIYLVYEQFQKGASLLVLKYQSGIKIMITEQIEKNVATGTTGHWIMSIWLVAVLIFFVALFLILLIHDRSSHTSKRLDVYYSEKKKEISQREDNQTISKYKIDDSHAEAPDIIDEYENDEYADDNEVTEDEEYYYEDEDKTQNNN